ncbi:MAG: phosphoribosylaminoimidazolesuccinocarboxamide synthase [Patescibacteria group bacterium]
MTEFNLDWKRGDKLAQGKTKIVWSNAADPETEILEFKDDITAGDGQKHDVIKGKALVDWKTNRDIMEFLKRQGISMAYIGSPEERIVIVRKLTKVLKLEVVMRRVATGSILDLMRGAVKEGDVFDPPLLQFFYKDDLLHDPLLDANFLLTIEWKKKPMDLFTKIAMLKLRQFLILEAAFAKYGIQYMDDKMEIGVNLKDYDARGELTWGSGGQIMLIDEITAGSFRAWPYAEGVKKINLRERNAIDQLNKGGMLDKQLYRDGASTKVVKEKFEQIAAITAGFKNLDINVAIPDVSLAELLGN